jgi:NAD(P)-dependent dehydrogenase (short-subunit alcohol dehydrogenase family)
MKAAVVTGVSTGIGLATGAMLAQRGVHVFGSVRRAADAEPAAAACDGNFTPLVFDVTDEQLIEEAGREVRARLDGERLFGLVNNAGASPCPVPRSI